LPSSSVPSQASAATSEQNSLPFFPVSISKLVVLSVCTAGFYQLFWFQMNWRRVREREHSHILPLMRALCAALFCYAMFRRVRDFPAKSKVHDTLPVGLLAVGWILTTYMWILPEPYSLISLLSFLFIIPVQRFAARINEVVAPNHNRNGRFTAVNWVTVVVGGLLVVLGVIGSFLPEP
jgi:hypothetical protein